LKIIKSREILIEMTEQENCKFTLEYTGSGLTEKCVQQFVYKGILNVVQTG